MAIEIPDRKVDLIIPEFWYIIYEENLLAPKILRYSFRAESFAKSYALKRLKGSRYNILSGATLISFGFERAYRRNSTPATPHAGSHTHKYDYPDGLPFQRKKTIRTMYRRNYRRLLKKLLEHNEGT